MKTLFAPLLAAAALQAQAAPPDLDAVVSYESRQLLSSGVTRVDTWQERFSRRGEQVWTQRLLPAQAPHEAAEAHAGHKHFDFDTAARLLARDAKGEIELRFIDREHKVVVSVPKAEYGAVGFDGRWDAAAHLVPPGLVQQMRRGSAEAGGVWLEQKQQGWTHRVLWSDAKQVALRVESERDDGSIRRSVSLTPADKPAALPWAGIERYTQKVYDDFLD